MLDSLEIIQRIAAFAEIYQRYFNTSPTTLIVNDSTYRTLFRIGYIEESADLLTPAKADFEGVSFDIYKHDELTSKERQNLGGIETITLATNGLLKRIKNPLTFKLDTSLTDLPCEATSP